MNESIKKEVEFQGVFKKNPYEISMGLAFFHNSVEFPALRLCFPRNFQGKHSIPQT